MPELLGQPCSKSDIPVGLVTSCPLSCSHLGQAVRARLVGVLLTDLLQVA